MAPFAYCLAAGALAHAALADRFLPLARDTTAAAAAASSSSSSSSTSSAQCPETTLTVDSTLSGFADASSSLVSLLPSYGGYFQCGYKTCFNSVMSSWSSWEFGSMATSPATTMAANATTTATSTPSTTTPSSTASTASTTTPSSKKTPSTPTPHASITASPKMLVRDADREPYPSMSEAMSSCCGYCQVWVGNAQILWWPESEKPLKPNAVTTTVFDGTAVTFPTVYVAYTGANALNFCGFTGTSMTGGVVPVPTSDIKRLLKPSGWATDAFGGVTAAITPSDFAGCAGATQWQYTFTETVSGTEAFGDKCYPTLVVPTQIVGQNTQWKSCVGGIFGMGDPPQTLTLAGDTTVPPPATAFPTTPPNTNPLPPPEPVNVPPPNQPAPTTKPAPPPAPQPTTGPASPPGGGGNNNNNPNPVNNPGNNPGNNNPGNPPNEGSQPDPSPAPGAPAPKPSVFSVDSDAFTVDEVTATDSRGKSNTVVGLAVDGTTLTAGHAALTVDGNVVSLGASELVVGSRTETFHPAAAAAPTAHGAGSAASPSVDMGDVIMSGLGQIGGTPAPAAAPTGSEPPINQASGSGVPGGAMPTIVAGSASRSLGSVWDRLCVLFAMVAGALL